MATLVPLLMYDEVGGESKHTHHTRTDAVAHSSSLPLVLASSPSTFPERQKASGRSGAVAETVSSMADVVAALWRQLQSRQGMAVLVSPVCECRRKAFSLSAPGQWQ